MLNSLHWIHLLNRRLTDSNLEVSKNDTSVIPNSNRKIHHSIWPTVEPKKKRGGFSTAQFDSRKGCMTRVDCCARTISFSLSLPFCLFCDDGDHLASPSEHVAGFDVQFTPKHWPKSFAKNGWRSGILLKMPLNSSIVTIVIFIQVFEMRKRVRVRHSVTPWETWGGHEASMIYFPTNLSHDI